MCIRDSINSAASIRFSTGIISRSLTIAASLALILGTIIPLNFSRFAKIAIGKTPVSYTHLRAHETVLDLVCRLLLEKKHNTNKKKKKITSYTHIT